jgi:hypothetical protein
LGFLFFCGSIALLLLLAGRGGEEKELGGAIADGFGEEHMVDQWMDLATMISGQAGGLSRCL